MMLIPCGLGFLSGAKTAPRKKPFIRQKAFVVRFYSTRLRGCQCEKPAGWTFFTFSAGGAPFAA
jgi:hypothetical protein